MALGGFNALLRVGNAISANASRRVPYRGRCPRAIHDINCPGPNSPDGCKNELIGSGSMAENTEPRRCLDCCSAITVTTTDASPETMAAPPSPIPPADHPPPGGG